MMLRLEVFTFLMYCRVAFHFEAQDNRRRAFSRFFEEEMKACGLSLSDVQEMAVSIAEGSLRWIEGVDKTTAIYFLSFFASNNESFLILNEAFRHSLKAEGLTISSYSAEIKRRLSNYQQKNKRRKTKVVYRRLNKKPPKRIWTDRLLDSIEGQNGPVAWYTR